MVVKPVTRKMERLYDVADFTNRSSVISFKSKSYSSFEYLHHTVFDMNRESLSAGTLYLINTTKA
jgi:hypothetical protein